MGEKKEGERVILNLERIGKLEKKSWLKYWGKYVGSDIFE